jgi:hypothetical protein
MPQAIVPLITALGVSAGTALVIAQVVWVVLVNVALGAISKKLAKKNEQGTPPLNVTIRNSIEPRHLVFGTRRCGGLMAYYGGSSSGGSTNDYLWYVIVMAGHQVASITDVYLETEKIAGASINGTTGAVTGKFAGKLNIWKHLGTGAQTVDTNVDAAFSDWTSSHKLQGCAYIVIRMQRDDAVFNGVPQSVTAIVSGALVYDPRSDSTNGGSGSQRANNPSTWSATGNRNPALIARWLLTGGSVTNDSGTRLIRYGLQETDSRIDDSYVIASANICDESIVGTEAPPSGAQNRYLCDIEVTCGETRRDVVNAILATMAGRAIYTQGKWRLYAGAYDTPIHTLTQDDLTGDLEVQDTSSHSERYNAVAATFVDAGQQYIDSTTIFRTDSVYETQDGNERLPREIDLRGVTNQYSAQRLCEIELRRSRMQRVIKIAGSLNLLKVALNETAVFSHARYGWVNRVFRCMERQFDFGQEAGRVVLTLQRDDSGVYTDMLTADYTTGTSATDQYQDDGPYSPTSLAYTPGGNAITFTIGLPSYMGAGTNVQLFEHTSATPFSSAVLVAEGRGSIVVLPKSDTTTRFYWARLKDMNGAVSGTFPASSGMAASAGALATNTNQLVDGAGLGTTAVWGGITGSGKPVDDATQNRLARGSFVTVSTANPQNTELTGTTWVDLVTKDGMGNVIDTFGCKVQLIGLLSGGTFDIDLYMATSADWRIVSRRTSDGGDVTVLYSSVVNASPSPAYLLLDEQVPNTGSGGDRDIVIQIKGPGSASPGGAPIGTRMLDVFYYK